MTSEQPARRGAGSFDQWYAGLRSMQAEGERSLATWDAMRRVFATATAP